MLKVAVVILNWNTRELLERFLPLVLKTSSTEGIKVFVADNGSTDDSVEFLKKNYHREIGIILLDRNYGFAEGYNRALTEIEAEYFVLLNSDVEPSPGWLAPLIDIMEADQFTAACMPKIKAYDKQDFFEYAGAAGGFIDKYGFTFCRGRLFHSIETDYGQYDEPASIFWATGACVMIRGPLFKIMGGLDPYFFAHMEEVDLCWRLKNRGYKIKFTPYSVVYHIGGGTLPHGSPGKTYLNFRNNLFLLYKNLPENSLISIILQRIILDILAALQFLITGEFSSFMAVIKAHVSFIKHYGRYKKFRKDEKKFITRITHKEVYNRSIVIDFFIRKKITYKSLRWGHIK